MRSYVGSLPEVIRERFDRPVRVEERLHVDDEIFSTGRPLMGSTVIVSSLDESWAEVLHQQFAGEPVDAVDAHRVRTGTHRVQ